MQLQTSDYITMYCLPDNARCKISGENPEVMCECPMKKYDPQGNICCPETCEHYTEEEMR